MNDCGALFTVLDFTVAYNDILYACLKIFLNFYMLFLNLHGFEALCY